MSNGSGEQLYPLWIGIVATAFFGLLLWDTGAPDAPTTDADAAAAPDAAPPDAAPAAAPVPKDAVVWTVAGRPFPSPGALRSCLEKQDYTSGVTGVGDLTITWKSVVQSVTPDGDALRLATSVGGRCWDAAALHIATAFCLRAPGATLRDPLLGMTRQADRWPRPRDDGGLPLDMLVVIDGDPPRTRGLRRFGLPELTAPGVGPTTLYRAVGAFLVGCKPSATEIPLISGGRATLVHTPGGPSVATIRAPRRPKPRAPTSTADHPPRAPAIPRPRRPKRPKPSFQPDYR